MDSGSSSDEEACYESDSKAPNVQVGSNFHLKRQDSNGVSCSFDYGSECCENAEEMMPGFEFVETHESLRPAFVYMITSPSKKRYIGETKRTVSQRMKQHRDLRHSGCRLIRNSIMKYGWERMHVQILWEGPPFLRKDKEAELIAKYHTMAPRGYNCTAGGDSNPMDTEEGRFAVRESWKRGDVRQRHTDGRKAAWQDKTKRANIIAGRAASEKVAHAKAEGKQNATEANAKRTVTWEKTREQRLVGLSAKARIQKLARLKRDRERKARKRTAT